MGSWRQNPWKCRPPHKIGFPGVFNSQPVYTQPQAIHQNHHLSVPINNWLQQLLCSVIWSLLRFSECTCLPTFWAGSLPRDISSLGPRKVIAFLFAQHLSCCEAGSDNFQTLNVSELCMRHSSWNFSWTLGLCVRTPIHSPNITSKPAQVEVLTFKLMKCLLYYEIVILFSFYLLRTNMHAICGRHWAD